MSPQADYVVSNGTGAAVRSDINGQLAAIVSNNSGASAPATTYAYQFWADTSTNLLKLRNGANSAFITVGDLTAANLGLATLASPTFTGTATIPTLTVSTAANIPLGSAASPTLYFTGDSNTGLYSPGADQVALSTGGTGRLFIDSSGRCGIGTSSPADALHVVGKIAVTGTNPSIRQTVQTANLDLCGGTTVGTDSSIQLYGSSSPSDANHTFYNSNVHIWRNAAGSTQYGRFDSSGRLGIGTTSAAARLHVSGSDTTNVAFNGATKGIRFDFDGTQSTIYGVDNTFFGSYQPLKIGGSYTAFASSGNEIARFDTSGRLLVGTSSSLSANRTFQVAGTGGEFLSASATAGDLVPLILSRTRGTIGSPTVVSSGDGIGSLTYKGYDGTNYIDAAGIKAEVDGTPGTNDMPGRLVFSTTADGASSPTERMRINNAGNMSFNGTDVTVTTGNAGQVYKFFGGANNTVIALESTGANRFGVFEYRRSGRSGNARAAQISLGENASNQGVVDIYSSAANADVSGGVTLQNGATSWSSISDIRLKNVVSHFDNALADVSKLDAFRFTWKSDISEAPQVGLSAQSVQTVLPEAIASGKLINASKDEDTEYLSVRYTEVIPLLVAALQESKQRIEALEAEVAALKAQ